MPQINKDVPGTNAKNREFYLAVTRAKPFRFASEDGKLTDRPGDALQASSTQLLRGLLWEYGYLEEEFTPALYGEFVEYRHKRFGLWPRKEPA